jgi:pimeloyl-ACP methyl ester carboxylesterase
MAEKVIVVTHSMGGMVSRALTEIHQCDKVLGVSHGVLPATGAPAYMPHARGL